MTSSNEGDPAGDLFHAFFDSAPIGAAVIASDGSWCRVNAALASMLGYSVDELMTKPFFDLTHPADLRATAEKRLRARDGNYVWVHTTAMHERDTDGGGDHFMTYVLDIAARKDADAELRRSELQYRRLFESAKDGILILDAETGRVVDANPFMTELTGYRRDDLLGKLLWEIGPFADEAASKFSFAALKDRGYVRYDDLPLKTIDGRKVEVEFVSNVYLVNDEKVIQCNVRDITARKKAEAALRMRDRAIEAVSQGILITDTGASDNPIVYASPGFTALTGYTNEESLGRNCRFLQGPGTDPGSVALLRGAIQEGRACAVELLNFRKDGTPFWNSVALSPVKDDGGHVTHFIGVQTDVTARRQLESQVLQAQKMEAVGRLAGGIAHDFNNILAVILNYAELICADPKAGEPFRTDVEEIRTAARRATGLTKQLLAFSRQQVLETKVLSCNEILLGMQKLLARLLGADVELTMLPSDNLGNVKADPSQVEQIIMNLAINARDAMPQGGKLTIETGNVELDDDYADVHHDVRPGSYVLMAVSDTGVGMNKETQARIFDPFFTTKEQGKGTGLGLATVFGIVKQSGGHVFVYSEPGKGSTFKVYLPRVGAPLDVRPAEEPQSEESVCTGGTILLVEDEEQVRTLTGTILRRQGYVVLEAPNGGEAFLISEQHGGKIDLLLTDVVLPRMSGRQLAERLAPVRPTMRVLYMSGYTDDAILQHGIIDSGYPFLQKPFTPSSLAKKVKYVLNRASSAPRLG